MKVLIVLVAVITTVAAFPGGAPFTACPSMTPSHGVPASTDPSPYYLKVSTTCHNGASSTVDVTIWGDQPFLGFFVQAWSAEQTDGGSSLGMFDDMYWKHRTVDCFFSSKNAITHSTRINETSTSFMWMASGVETDVKFRATVVQTQPVFWTGIESATVTYDPNCNAPASNLTTPVPPMPGSASAVFSHHIVTISLVIALFFSFLV